MELYIVYGFIISPSNLSYTFTIENYLFDTVTLIRNAIKINIK